MMPPLWAFLGLFAGGWKLALVAAVTAAVFWRRLAPLLASEGARVLKTAPARGLPRRWTFGDRVFFFLVVLAAVAVSTWIVVHFTVSNPSARAEARARPSP